MARETRKKPAGPRWRRRKGERPAEITAAALDVFAARGFAAARLEDVAAQAGISKGTLYLYFRNKEELFKAVVRETLLPNLAQAEARIGASDGATPELLLGILRGLAGVAGTRLGAIPKLIIAEAGNFPDIARFYVEEVVLRGMALFAGLLARGAARGELRRVDPLLAAPVLAAPILLMAIWKNVLEPHAPRSGAMGGFDAGRFFDVYADILLNGLRAAPEVRP
jgi:AcrR family transcriptional regulator